MPKAATGHVELTLPHDPSKRHRPLNGATVVGDFVNAGKRILTIKPLVQVKAEVAKVAAKKSHKAKPKATTAPAPGPGKQLPGGAVASITNAGLGIPSGTEG